MKIKKQKQGIQLENMLRCNSNCQASPSRSLNSRGKKKSRRIESGGLDLHLITLGKAKTSMTQPTAELAARTFFFLVFRSGLRIRDCEEKEQKLDGQRSGILGAFLFFFFFFTSHSNRLYPPRGELLLFFLFFFLSFPQGRSPWRSRKRYAAAEYHDTSPLLSRLQSTDNLLQLHLLAW